MEHIRLVTINSREGIRTVKMFVKNTEKEKVSRHESFMTATRMIVMVVNEM